MADKKILVVDDEPNNLQLLRQILKNDYSLVFARRGLEALAAVEKHLPDLVLLDIMMPDMDGYETCRRLKNNQATAHIPVIFVTAMSDVGDETRGFMAGGVDYIIKPVSSPIVQARVRTHLSLVRIEELEKSQRAAVYMLGEAGHYNDDDTGVHIWRMAEYSRIIAKESGLPDKDCMLIELAAPMHDTGKIGIPDAVLKKPDKLNADEWKIMKKHSEIGYSILSKSDTPLFKLAAQIAYRHHERWDGKGYPDGLAGDAIPEAARIVAIADIFDALTMKRPYKEIWTVEDATAEIEKYAGAHLDPRLTQAFLKGLPAIVQARLDWNKKDRGSAYGQ